MKSYIGEKVSCDGILPVGSKGDDLFVIGDVIALTFEGNSFWLMILMFYAEKSENYFWIFHRKSYFLLSEIIMYHLINSDESEWHNNL